MPESTPRSRVPQFKQLVGKETAKVLVGKETADVLTAAELATESFFFRLENHVKKKKQSARVCVRVLVRP